MPIPEKTKKEKESSFMNRCISDKIMKEEFPDIKQRIAICIQKKNEKNKKKS